MKIKSIFQLLYREVCNKPFLISNKTFTLLLVSLIAVGLYCLRLGDPAVPVFDEVYYLPSVRALLSASGYGENTHPPLGKELLALSVYFLGDSPFGGRFVSALCGGVVLFFSSKLITHFSNVRIGLVVALLMFCDMLVFSQHRICMINAPMMAFMMASLYVALSAKGKVFYLAYVLLGLSLACRVASITSLPLILLMHFRREELIKKWLRLLIGLSLMVVVYLLTYIPLIFAGIMTASDVFSQHIAAFEHHTNRPDPHRYASAWFTWPFLIRPVWYGFLRHVEQNALGQQMLEGILCVGNPALFACFLLALVWYLYAMYKSPEKIPEAKFVIAGWLINWLPWALAPRYTFFHYYYTAMPFVCMVVARFLQSMYHTKYFRSVSIIAILMIVGCFAFFYPVVTAIPLPEEQFMKRVWLSTWW